LFLLKRVCEKNNKAVKKVKLNLQEFVESEYKSYTFRDGSTSSPHEEKKLGNAQERKAKTRT
jgi:hypothetical protein